MTQFSAAGSDEKIVAHVDSDLKELIPGFIENRWQDTHVIVACVELMDYETIQGLGHDMKGSGGGYGFDAITDIGQSLEQAAKDENPTEVLKLAKDLVTYLARVEIVYE